MLDVLRASTMAPLKTTGQREEVLSERRDDQKKVRRDEEQEDRDEDRHALLDPPEVQEHQEREDHQLGAELVAVEVHGQEAEDLIHPGRRGRRDREDVVDDQRAPGDDAEAGTEELGRDEVTRRRRPGRAR